MGNRRNITIIAASIVVAAGLAALGIRHYDRYPTTDDAYVDANVVGIVARETPAAMERALPVPETAMTSNTEIIPVTVPSRPSNGHSATKV